MPIQMGVEANSNQLFKEKNGQTRLFNPSKSVDPRYEQPTNESEMMRSRRDDYRKPLVQPINSH